MSTDQMRVMREGFCVDGSKVERELNINYTPIRVAIEEAIASYRVGSSPATLRVKEKNQYENPEGMTQ
jgi:hypothetical protein